MITKCKNIVPTRSFLTKEDEVGGKNWNSVSAFSFYGTKNSKTEFENYTSQDYRMVD